MKYTGIVLSGGRSSRMQTNKAFLTINQKQVISHIIGVLKQAVHEILIVTNDPDLYAGLGERAVTDIIPHQGPLSGVHAGLISASHRHSFVVACDMPFVEPQLIEYLLRHTEARDDVIVPRSGSYLQPLYAVYSKRCLPAIEDCLSNNVRKLTAFYDRVRVKYIEEDAIRQLVNPDEVFFNINTPAEYALACELAKRTGVREIK